MEDIEKNLDLLVREAFADATEEVSPAVWAGVSRGLAKASAPKAVFPVWLRWAGLSLAAAAAVALGVFLFTRSGNSNLPIYNNDGQVVADVPAPVTVTDAEVVAPRPGEQPSRSANLLASAVIPGAAEESSSPVIPSAVDESSSPVTPSAAEDSSSLVIPSEVEESTSPVVPGAAEESNSAVAETAFFRDEPVRKNTGVSLLAGANLGGNVGSRSAAPARMGTSGSGSGIPQQGMYGLDEFKYGLPISATLGVKWQFHPRWAVGTGVSFTMLPSSCSGTYVNGAGEEIYSDHINHFQTYVGVPLNFYFTIVESKAVGFYTFAGAAVERSIINRYTFHKDGERIRYNEPVKGVQPSVGLGIGVDFRFTKFLSLYIDPSARYYFDCKQPQSIRTAQPFSLSLDAGLRFGF